MNGALKKCESGHVYSTRVFGKECPFCKKEAELLAQEEKSEELEHLLLKEELEPVCGWLVCISGPQQGRDYRIKAGKNFAGRADDMDIQILNDNKVARRNHAVIVFDPKQKNTLLLPGDSNGLVYHNNVAVFAPTVLASYDVIEMGDSQCVFVPFCGENFMWVESSSQKNDQSFQLKQPTSTASALRGARESEGTNMLNQTLEIEG